MATPKTRLKTPNPVEKLAKEHHEMGIEVFEKEKPECLLRMYKEAVMSREKKEDSAQEEVEKM